VICALFDAVESLAPGTVAVVGLAKNCGKTTALNALLGEYARRGFDLAATSAGRDGEAVDALTLEAKPPIELPGGALAATAERTLERWAAPFEELGRLGVSSSVGEIVLVRSTAPGMAELAGPPTVAGMRRALEELRRLGAGRILIDGAFDRIAVGDPGVTDAVVLAAGAVLAGSAESVAGIVAHRAGLLGLRRPEGEAAARLSGVAEALGSRAAAVSEGFDVQVLPESALADPVRTAEAAGGAKWLLCGGAVEDGLLRSLAESGAKVNVVARDATRIFVEPATLGRWLGAEGGLHVLRRVKLAAIVTNPHNPTGPDLAAAELARAVASAVEGVPVFDVVAGISHNTGAGSGGH